MDNPNNNIAFIITTTNTAQLQLTTNVGLMVNTINSKQQTIDKQTHQIDHRQNQQRSTTTYNNVMLIIITTNIKQPTTTLD
jgi:hypothetical protein